MNGRHPSPLPQMFHFQSQPRLPSPIPRFDAMPQFETNVNSSNLKRNRDNEQNMYNLNMMPPKKKNKPSESPSISLHQVLSQQVNLFDNPYKMNQKVAIKENKFQTYAVYVQTHCISEPF